ncbi:hypothetical protein LXL04_019158 [Taraxacum kok-saghyz]
MKLGIGDRRSRVVGIGDRWCREVGIGRQTTAGRSEWATGDSMAVGMGDMLCFRDAAAEGRGSGVVGFLVGVVGAVRSLADAGMKLLKWSDFEREEWEKGCKKMK